MRGEYEIRLRELERERIHAEQDKAQVKVNGILNSLSWQLCLDKQRCSSANQKQTMRSTSSSHNHTKHVLQFFMNDIPDCAQAWVGTSCHCHLLTGSV